MRRKRLYSLLGLMLLLFTACSSQEFVSSEPTDYTRAVHAGSKGYKIYYLTAEHPDVQAILPLAEDFLSIDQTQDYRNPDWGAATPLATASLLAARQERESGFLKEHEIIKHLAGFQGIKIILLGDNSATVMAELEVVFTSLSARYAGWYNLELNQPSPVLATLNLRRTDDLWQISSARYSYLAP